MHVHTVEIEVTCTELLSVMDAKGNQASKRTSKRMTCLLCLIYNIPSLTWMQKINQSARTQQVLLASPVNKSCQQDCSEAHK